MNSRWERILNSAQALIAISAALIAALGWVIKLQIDVSNLKERVHNLEGTPRVLVQQPDPRKKTCADLALLAADPGSTRADQAMVNLGCREMQ